MTAYPIIDGKVMIDSTHNITGNSQRCSYCNISIFNSDINKPCYNAPPAPAVPKWARKLAVERAGHTGYLPSDALDKMTNLAAELIAKYEQEPVRPDVLRARWLLDKHNSPMPGGVKFADGTLDETPSVRAVVAALHEGRYNGLTAAYDLLYDMDKDHVFDDVLSRIATLRSKNLW